MEAREEVKAILHKIQFQKKKKKGGGEETQLPDREESRRARQPAIPCAMLGMVCMVVQNSNPAGRRLSEEGESFEAMCLGLYQDSDSMTTKDKSMSW